MSVIARLREEITEREQRIKAIQDECSHPPMATTKEAGSNTGNWCPGDDEYWYDYHCTLCDKHWRTPQ